jgi:23S rRNA (uracil1939-C5)-methyltransferase
MSVHIGDLLEDLCITDLTLDGQAVARHHGLVVFLDQGLPGARVTAEVRAVKKGLVQATVVRELHPSPDAAQPWCPHFPLCGGCSRQNLSLEAGRELKRNQLRQSLARIGKMPDLPVREILPSPESFTFRNKMSFAFARTPDNRVDLGLRRLRSHEVIGVRHCGLQPPVVMEILDFVRLSATELGLSPRCHAPASAASPKAPRRRHEGYLRFLVVRTPAHVPPGGKAQVLVECITGPEHDETTLKGGMSNGEAVMRMGESLMRRFDLVGFVHSRRSRHEAMAQGEATVDVLGQDFFEERLGDHVLQVPYNAFLQTNTGAAEALYAQIARESRLTGQEIVWDVYCGIGGIALGLAGQARAVYGFEVQPEAVRAAEGNADRLGLGNCHFQVWDAEQGPPEHVPPPDCIVVDPPRSGLSAAFCHFLRECPARRLLYVSCDPGSQARDAALLSGNWRAVTAVPVDMFPWTAHVECLLVFERR